MSNSSRKLVGKVSMLSWRRYKVKTINGSYKMICYTLEKIVIAMGCPRESRQRRIFTLIFVQFIVMWGKHNPTKRYDGGKFAYCLLVHENCTIFEISVFSNSVALPYMSNILYHINFLPLRHTRLPRDQRLEDGEGNNVENQTALQRQKGPLVMAFVLGFTCAGMTYTRTSRLTVSGTRACCGHHAAVT